MTSRQVKMSASLGPVFAKVMAVLPERSLEEIAADPTPAIGPSVAKAITQDAMQARRPAFEARVPSPEMESSVLSADDAKIWFLVHTKPRQEDVALVNLERQGYRCYLPRLRVEKILRRKAVVVIEPMFSRYLFVRLYFTRP